MTHEQMVKNLVKPGSEILAQVSPDMMGLIHMILGVAGETGELLDAIKKAAIYQKPIDMENVIEELGDIEFYLEGMRQQLGITRDQTLDANIAKLSKRYHSGSYSDTQAQERADK